MAWIESPAENRRWIAPSIQALIEGIYETESHRTPSQAFTILRRRIFTTESATLTEQELVKSSAKRLAPRTPLPANFTAATIPPEPLMAPRLPPDFIEIAGAQIPAHTSDENIRATLELLQTFSQTITPQQGLWNANRAVSALLVDADGSLRALAWNTNAVIRNRHAEWNLCEDLIARGEKIPIGATLYVSLKPCRMCSAKIWETAEDPAALRVRYLEEDPGPWAQATLLDTDSPARLRYFGPSAPCRFFAIQEKLPVSR